MKKYSMFFRNKILSEIKCDSIFVGFFLVSGGRNNLSKKKILTEYSQDSTNKIDFKIIVSIIYRKHFISQEEIFNILW